MATKPLLAATLKKETIVYPLYATPKVDGIRLLKQNGRIVSRSFKEIKNKNIVELMKKVLPEGCDGEIFIKDQTISDVTSLVNSIEKSITDYELEYYIFDMITPELKDKNYLERIQSFPQPCQYDNINIIPLVPKKLNNEKEMRDFEEECLGNNFEGIMLRRGDGRYKCGRSTLKECILVKVKRFVDTEGEIVGFEEMKKNQNKQELNELGENFRSSKKAGMVLTEKLGAFVVQLEFKGKITTVDVGSGFTHAQRTDFWNDKKTLLGRIVKFKYFEIGSKTKPRHPIFLCFRDPDDM
jgi:DNA ligase-1